MMDNTKCNNEAQINENVAKFAKITESMLKIYELKNSDYGNSFDETCNKFGITAAIVRMYDKLNRISTLSRKDPSVVDESIRDTLLDLANYAIMTILWCDNRQQTKL